MTSAALSIATCTKFLALAIIAATDDKATRREWQCKTVDLLILIPARVRLRSIAAVSTHPNFSLLCGEEWTLRLESLFMSTRPRARSFQIDLIVTKQFVNHRPLRYPGIVSIEIALPAGGAIRTTQQLEAGSPNWQPERLVRCFIDQSTGVKHSRWPSTTAKCGRW